MTLEQLRMLKTLTEKGTLKQTSETLFKSQSAISQGIKQLESQLGVTLFSRDNYRLALTAEGRHIYQHAVRVLNEISEIEQISHHFAKGNEESVTLALEASFDLESILPTLEITQREFPDTQIIIQQEYLTGAYEAVKSSGADISISPYSSLLMSQDTFEKQFLYQGRRINVASTKLLMRHPDLSNINQLRSEFQILIKDSGLGTKGKDLGVQLGQRRWYVNDFETKRLLIKNGLGWGSLPEHVVRQDLEKGDLQSFKLMDSDIDLHVNYFAMKLQLKILGPVGRNLWENLVGKNVVK